MGENKKQSKQQVSDGFSFPPVFACYLNRITLLSWELGPSSRDDLSPRLESGPQRVKEVREASAGKEREESRGTGAPVRTILCMYTHIWTKSTPRHAYLSTLGEKPLHIHRCHAHTNLNTAQSSRLTMHPTHNHRQAHPAYEVHCSHTHTSCSLPHAHAEAHTRVVRHTGY